MIKETDSLENQMIRKYSIMLYNKTILVQNLFKLNKCMFLDSHTGRE